MPPRIPPIQCLLTFEALARLRSVTQAADELCVTPSAVSRWSALSARRVSRYSAREVNMRYGSLVPRVTKSSIITPI